MLFDGQTTSEQAHPEFGAHSACCVSRHRDVGWIKSSYFFDLKNPIVSGKC